MVGRSIVAVTPTHSIVSPLVGPAPAPVRRPSPELLPRHLGPLVGRDVELAQIERAVADDEVVEVSGPTGVGKSSLIRHAARRLAGSGDGVVFLDAVTGDPDDVLQRAFECCYDTSGYKPTPIELRRLLGDLRLCLVVDRLSLQPEGLTRFVDVVASSAVVLATPQRSMWGHGLAVELGGIDRTAGVELLARTLGRDVQGDEATRAAALWAACNGNPQDLIRVASAARAAGAPLPLPGEVQGLATRVVERLPAAAIDVLRVLALVPTAGAHGDLLAALTAREPVGWDGRLPEADLLVEAGLAVATDGAYRLAPGVEQSLGAQLSLGAHVGEVASRLTAWVSTPGREPGWVAGQAPFIEGVVVAASAAGRPDEGSRLARKASPLLLLALLWGGWSRILSVGKDAARRAGDPSSEAYFAHEQGVRSVLLGQVAAGAASLGSAAALLHQLGQGGSAAANHAQALEAAARSGIQGGVGAPVGAGAGQGGGLAPGAVSAGGVSGASGAGVGTGAGLAAKVLALVVLAAAVGVGALAFQSVNANDEPSDSIAGGGSPDATLAPDPGSFPGGTAPGATVTTADGAAPGGTAPGSGTGAAGPGGTPPAAGFSMIAETFGPEDANASYPFVVGEGATLSGTVEFLSNEWPVYFGQEYNDLYTVTLATPGGVVVLASGNLNSSSWVDGSDHGYSGTADAVTVSADLRRFAGQVAELKIHVANVGDDSVESAVVVSDLRIDAASPCDDEALAELHGLASASGSDRLDGLDHVFNGTDGAGFHNLVQLVAAEAGVEPGLLAVTALDAQGSLDAWLSPDGLAPADAGVPDWATAEAELRAALPDSPAIATTATGSFSTGRDALRALAWTLRHADARLIAEAGPAYSDLPANERTTLQAFAVDEGVPAAVDAAGQGTVMVTDPAATGPQRAATVRGAQAIHLSYVVFGMGASCGP